MLELKLIADVGLVGLAQRREVDADSQRSRRRARKVADYPFTTLHPNLGVVSVGPGRSFVMADIPGLDRGGGGWRGFGDPLPETSAAHARTTASDRHRTCIDPASRSGQGRAHHRCRTEEVCGGSRGCKERWLRHQQNRPAGTRRKRTGAPRMLCGVCAGRVRCCSISGATGAPAPMSSSKPSCVIWRNTRGHTQAAAEGALEKDAQPIKKPA